jgi:L-ascorbate metabolism protein UlaG (beta-lactamase superfamily)
MTITKYGHCCLLIEINNKRILTDPGKFSDGFETLTDIDIILITHEHADHCHTEAIAELLEKNPAAIVVSNSSVATLLREHGISTHVVEGREHTSIIDTAIEAFDGKHEEIFGDYGLVQNTGYLVENSFFYPGDSYIVPDKPVTVLALPVAGPWCKIADALRYGLSVKPQLAIPVHDAVLSEAGRAVTYGHFERELPKQGIIFSILKNGESLTTE